MEAEENEENEENEEKENQEPETQVPNQSNGPATIQCQSCAECNHIISNAIIDKDSDSQRSSQSERDGPSTEFGRTATEPSVSSGMRRATTNQSEKSMDTGGRRQVARLLNLASRQLAARAHSHMEDTGFNAQEKLKFPEIPGEFLRNDKLPDIQRAYSNTPLPRSRATSFAGSVDSNSSNGEGNSRIIQGPFRQLSLQVPAPARISGRRPHSNTLPSRRSSFEYSVQRDGTITPNYPSGGPSSPDELSRFEQQPRQPPVNPSPNALQINMNVPPLRAQSPAPQIVVSSSKKEETDSE